jgi:hypothetical protein
MIMKTFFSVPPVARGPFYLCKSKGKRKSPSTNVAFSNLKIKGLRFTFAVYLCGLPLRFTFAVYLCGLPLRFTFAVYLAPKEKSED